MNIGLIYHGEFPTHPRIENQAMNLINKGFNVYLFCVTYDPKQLRDEEYGGLKVKRYFYSKLVYKLSALAYTLPFYHSILKKDLLGFVKTNDISCIHMNNIHLGSPVFDISEQLNIPVVFDIHENIPEIMKEYPHMKTLMGRLLINPKIWKQYEEKFVQKAQKIIVVTDEARDEIVERTSIDPAKIFILPNYTTDHFVNAKLDSSIKSKMDGFFNIVYIGDTGLRRGLLSILKAVDHLKETIPNIRVSIVGKSRADSILIEEIERLQISQWVSMEGWVEESKLASYITQSNICICPLLRNKHHDTTYANKLFQYAAFGKPIVASDCPSQKKLIENNKWGLIHQADNPVDFGKKILQLYGNPGLMKTFGANGKKSIESQFNYNASKVHTIYEQLTID